MAFAERRRDRQAERCFVRLVSGSALALSMLAPQMAWAGPLGDAAASAEIQATEGDAAGARATIQTAIGEFSANLPLAIARAAFVSGEPSGYAMYDPRPNHDFAQGESLISYVEPVGLSWVSSPQAGKLETHFTVDFDILDPQGKVLAGQKAFGDFRFVSFQRNQEIYATLTIDVAGAPAGDYVLRFRFNDANSDKTAIIEQPFSITATAEPALSPPPQAPTPETTTTPTQP